MSTTAAAHAASLAKAQARRKLTEMKLGTIFSLADFPSGINVQDLVRKMLDKLIDEGLVEVDYVGKSGRKFYRLMGFVPANEGRRPVAQFGPLLSSYGYNPALFGFRGKRVIHRIEIYD